MNKYIVRHSVPGRIFANAYLIANNYDNSLHGYLRLKEIAEQDFGKINDYDIECKIVLKSGWCKNCTAIRIPIPSNICPDGWNLVENLPDISFG